MLRRWVFVVVAITTLVALVGFTAEARPLLPGDRMGTMRFVRGTAATADLKLFDICDPVILRPGRYVRSCAPVPRVNRLFIGHGVFAAPRAINRVWHPRRLQRGLTDAESGFARSERPIGRCISFRQRAARP